MTQTKPVTYETVERCADDVLAHLGSEIVLGLPLGLGKPNHFVNEIYRRAKANPSISLTICTALSLEKPRWSSDLERRFLEPFVERMFGGYVELEYISDLRAGVLPDNIEVKEFYTKAGSFLNVGHAQQNYISSNYTHAFRDLLDAGVNVLAQMVCTGVVDGERVFSLSANPDVSLDAAKVLREQEISGRKIAIIAEINENLPFMYGDAVVKPDFFTAVIDNKSYHSRLFGAPKLSIADADFMIGLYASSLIKDGGTLQIGIGSLGDALVYALTMRQEHNEVYQTAISRSGARDNFAELIADDGGVESFDVGLSGCTEMFVDGYLELMKSGVVKRKTYNNMAIQRLVNDGKLTEEITPKTLGVMLEEGVVSAKLSQSDLDFLKRYGILKTECSLDDSGEHILCDGMTIPNDLSSSKNKDQLVVGALGDRLKEGILIHGGFFLGPESFYAALKNMSEEERRLIYMTSVLRVNQLYENEYATEELKLLQRSHGRFVNACLMVTLNGGVVSDGLETGQMVSGVGGQYNFVSQAHALPGGRSILMCRATRAKGRDVHSNIVYNYGHITVPRHLRDIVITEYGVANLRSKSDKDIIAALLNITDSRFQDELLQRAKEEGKIDKDYEIPERHRNNRPERLKEALAPLKAEGYFPPFPFGTDFTKEELQIGKALKTLKARMSAGFKKVSSLSRAATMRVPEEALPYLQRLSLDSPQNAKEKMMQKLVVHALSISGVLQPRPSKSA